MQEVRQGLVPKFLRDQLISDQQMSPHQGDVAIKADAGVPRSPTGLVGFAALGRGRAGGVRLLAVCRLMPGVRGRLRPDGSAQWRAGDANGTDADPKFAAKLRHSHVSWRYCKSLPAQPPPGSAVLHADRAWPIVAAGDLERP